MNENAKKCYILGYGKYAEKESGEVMYRIALAIESNNENYCGLMVAPTVFLPYSEKLENTLYEAVYNKNCNVFYTTTDNIITGKTKINNIFIKNKDKNLTDEF